MGTEKIKLPSFAKINWFLRVLGKREDNFHDIFTVFQTVSLADEITFEESQELSLTCNDKNIPLDKKNLIIKAARILSERFHIEKGAKIHLEKKIPFPGGLGGASSNAAVALLGLSRLWRLPINLEDLVEIGSEIGSDVPFFLYGGTALGIGRGTEISTVADIAEEFMVIVTPNVDIPTAEAYSKVDAPRLTKSASKSILQNCYEVAEKLNSEHQSLFNDFENSVFKIKPEIKLAKEMLLDLGAKRALMSGSGASVFGVFDNEERRQTALRRLEAYEDFRTFPVETISRRRYRNGLELSETLLT